MTCFGEQHWPTPHSILAIGLLLVCCGENSAGSGGGLNSFSSARWSVLISMSRPGMRDCSHHRPLSVTESVALPPDPRRSIMPSPQPTLADDETRSTNSQLLQLRRQMLRHARSWPRGSSERKQRRQTAASFRTFSEKSEWLDAHTIFLVREDAHQAPRVALVDPMKSRETAGWLRGELRPPN